ncbi:MAG: hypothetical protein JRI44_03390 [Deltaproteobacteria bacterium]|nr:hypothetical protein [Deltaproteobacteria bacterium]
MDKNIEEIIKEMARDGKIPCAVCFKLAEKYNISKKEVGKILNRLGIKVSQCQLGLFK